MDDSRIPVNVPASQADEKRIVTETKRWNAPRLVFLFVGSLAFFLALLVWMSECQLTPLPH
jgi:hypothetical protein